MLQDGAQRPFVQAANVLIREIRMNFMKENQVPDLTTAALQGLTTASDPLVLHKVRELRISSDVNGFGTPTGSTPLDALAAPLEEVDSLYRTLCNQGDYAPANEAKKANKLKAMQADIKKCIVAILFKGLVNYII